MNQSMISSESSKVPENECLNNEVDFDLKGFQIVSISPLIPKLKFFKEEIYRIFDRFSMDCGLGRINNEQDIINFRKRNQLLQYSAVKHLYNSSALFNIGGDAVISNLLESDFGFKCPIHELQPQLRVDMPIKKQSIFKKHQDYAYNIGSKNSVTIWIPLQDTTEDMGALNVAIGSHKQGVYSNINGIIEADEEFNFHSLPISFGEALIFNQKLVHQSGFNRSDKIRFSIQLRFSDLGCTEYASRNYPINTIYKVAKYAGNNL